MEEFRIFCIFVAAKDARVIIGVVGVFFVSPPTFRCRTFLTAPFTFTDVTAVIIYTAVTDSVAAMVAREEINAHRASPPNDTQSGCRESNPSRCDYQSL